MKSLEHGIGNIFQPVYHLTADILTFIYGLVPNYAIAIALLTVVIMGVLTPFTVKSTRSMKAMQNLQPEIKKLQQKYKGAENRQVMNEELMKLYREEGVNPLGGCLPMLLQMPFLIILYGVIKGLANTVTKHGKIVADPRYVAHSSKMYENLIHSGGHLNVWGMDLSLRVFPISSHSSFWAALPFFFFVAAAVALQYFQMAMMNTRNQKTGQAMPSQQQAMQRFLPIIFAFFYIAIPAAVVLYMIISSGIRIITQDIIFRTDPKNKNQNKDKPTEKFIPGAEKSAELEAAPEEKPKPVASKSTNSSTPAKRPKAPAKPAPRPQSQARSKSKRKRKAR